MIAAFNAGFILLLLTPFGREQDGNRAWLKFPFLPVSIGPAEVVKITFIILLAWQFQWLLEEKRDLKSFSSAFMAAGHAFGMAGLYFIVSRDMGNAMMFVLIFVVMAFASGFALRWFVMLGAAGTIGGIAVWTLDLLPSYMKNRFLVLFDHSYDVQNQGLPADPQPFDYRRRRLLGTGVSPRHTDTGGNRLYSRTAHGPDFRRDWRGAWLCRCHAGDFDFGGHHHSRSDRGAAVRIYVPHLCLRGNCLHAGLSNDHQHRDVSVHHAGHRSDAAVFQLWWLLHRYAICCHGFCLRYQNAYRGPAEARASHRFSLLNQAGTGCPVPGFTICVFGVSAHNFHLPENTIPVSI